MPFLTWPTAADISAKLGVIPKVSLMGLVVIFVRRSCSTFVATLNSAEKCSSHLRTRSSLVANSVPCLSLSFAVGLREFVKTFLRRLYPACWYYGLLVSTSNCISSAFCAHHSLRMARTRFLLAFLIAWY